MQKRQNRINRTSIKTGCQCGRPLHYSCEFVKKQINKMVSHLGEYITVESIITRKKYKVQRHYIALHGLKHEDLDHMGFEQV